MSFLQKLTMAGLGCLAVCLAGCAEKTTEVQVSGEVSINGKPIPNGMISFVDKDGVAPTGGGVIQDGKYTAVVEPGSKTVLVLGNEVVGEEPEYQGVADSPMRKVYKTLTPTKYNAAHQSDLTADIKGPQDGLNFELTGNAPNIDDRAR